MTNDNPQVPWTDEQWARVNKVVQEEASRARMAATFLPLVGPLPADTDFVREGLIQNQPTPPHIGIQDKSVIQLATLQVKVPVRGAQMADPEMTSVLALFRRAANVLARLEDTVVFRGLVPDPALPNRFAPPIDVGPPPPQRVWEITGGERSRGLWTNPLLPPPSPQVDIAARPFAHADTRLVRGIAQAIGLLEAQGQFGPFAVVLDQALFLVAQTPTAALVLPQDRILPFLGGGPLLRSSTLNVARGVRSGVVVALGGEPVELVIATDVCVQFLQVTAEPNFVFRVCEKMALRIKEPEAIVRLIE
jgi:uncharacterized linocin/CFP29 family protein